MNNKGFTVIELILAIAIAGIIMGALGTFLTFNLRGFNATKDIIDIQYEAQLTMNQLSDIMKESGGILEIERASIDYINSPTGLVDPDLWTLSRTVRLEGDTDTTTYDYVFTYDHSTGIIQVERTQGTDVITYDVGRYIESITFEPSSQDFEMTPSLIIYATFTDGNATLDVQTEVKFRNKQ